MRVKAARFFSYAPGSGALALIALSVGFGLTLAMVAIIRGAGLPPVQAIAEGTLVRVQAPSAPDSRFSTAFLAWKADSDSLGALTPFYRVGVVLLGGTRGAEIENGVYVGHELVDLVKFPLSEGRFFDKNDDAPGATPVIVISADLKQERFGGANAVGEGLAIDGIAHNVIGVASEQFRFPLNSDFWLPIRPGLVAAERAGYVSFDSIATLKPGFTTAASESELDALASTPEMSAENGTTVTSLRWAYLGTSRQSLMLMSVAVAAILLAAAFNAGNFLHSHVLMRGREVTLRAALGATASSLAATLLSDVLSLLTLASVAGSFIGLVAIRIYREFGGLVGGAWVRADLGPTEVAFSLLVAVSAGLLVAAVPVLRFVRGIVARPQTEESLGLRNEGSVVRGSVVALQVGTSCLLLVPALAIQQSVVQLNEVEVAQQAEQVWVGQIALDTAAFSGWRDWTRFFAETEDRLESLGAVSEVAFATQLPTGATRKAEVSSATAGAQPVLGRWSAVSQGFFGVLGKELVSGRAFSEADRAGSEPVVILNQSLAAQLFGDEDPVGRAVAFQDVDRFGPPQYQVVGVAANLYLGRDAFSGEIALEDSAGFYVSILQHPTPGAWLLARYDLSMATVGEMIRSVHRESFPTSPLMWSFSLKEHGDQALRRYFAARSAFSVFGLAALVLAAVGLIALVELLGIGRRRELALRSALGASPSRLVWLLVRQIVPQVIMGLVLGVVAGVAVLRSLPTFLVSGGIDGWGSTALVSGVVLGTAALSILLAGRHSLRQSDAGLLR